MRLKSHYQKKILFGKEISIASYPPVNASIDATEVALPKENTIWKGGFNRLISARKGDFSPSIDATEVALPKENAIWEGDFNCLISTRKGDFSPSIDATEVALPKENANW